MGYTMGIQNESDRLAAIFAMADGKAVGIVSITTIDAVGNYNEVRYPQLYISELDEADNIVTYNDATAYHGDANDDGIPCQDMSLSVEQTMALAKAFYSDGQCSHGFDLADCPCLQHKCGHEEPFDCCSYMPELPA